MMDINQTLPCRLVGDYILGRRIGSGSFAVVWRSRHRISGLEVAVKEIDKKLLNPKVSENLLKEISILSTINHPNIIRLFESIESKDRIFLVLEYCEGGDLAEYIQRHRRVSETVARHFMRQLAAGLQVLQEKHLIHRDLKPQNLLLSSKKETPQLKIGDFGFARSLTPLDLADTLCGSPLYMAPEIIQNQKYDAKADLWSVGAILFQLVTGKPPFEGNSQYQLFQNVLTSTELQFPEGSLAELHVDCVDLCRSLLRQNPVERLTFKEFFNHRFLEEPRMMLDIEQPSLSPQMKAVGEQSGSYASIKGSQWHLEHSLHMNAEGPTSSSFHDDMVVHGKLQGSTSGTRSTHSSIPNVVCDGMGKSVDVSQSSVDQSGVANSTESIEKDYVLVNHLISMDNFSYLLETSLQGNSTAGVSIFPPKLPNQETEVAKPKRECGTSSAGNENFQEPDPLSTSSSLSLLKEVQELSILHPSTRLRFLHQYVQAVAEVAQEKYSAGLFLESFSVELVVLAIWKKALNISSSWLASTSGSAIPESSSANEDTLAPGGTDFSLEMTDQIDFCRPSSACKWAEQGFLSAFDRAEKLSSHVQNMDAAVKMPDAMEIIYQRALTFGTSGALDEYFSNKGSAVAAYSKAMLLLYFIIGEATTLPLNPPFSPTPANKKRIESFIVNFQSHRSNFSTLQPCHKQTPDSTSK